MRPKPNRLMDHREYPVLYVDDERDNLRVFQLTFRRDFTLLTAESASAGLELMAQHRVRNTFLPPAIRCGTKQRDQCRR